MMQENNPILSQTPRPEVSQVKEAIGFDAYNLPRYYGTAKAANIALSTTEDAGERAELAKTIREASIGIYGLIEALMVDAEDYITPDKEKEFKDKLIQLKRREQTVIEQGNFNADEVREDIRYIKKILKETNLTELGQKSRVKEIMQKIEVKINA
jgi:hypothetical protein